MKFTVLLWRDPSPLSERDVQSFFGRFKESVEILAFSAAPARYSIEVQKRLQEAAGDLIFILDPHLNVPLVEVLKAADVFAQNPEIQFVWGRRKLSLGPRERRLAQKAARTWPARHLSDPLTPFVALRAHAARSLRPLKARAFIAQELALRLPPPQQFALDVQSLPPRPIGFTAALRLSLELFLLARRRANEDEALLT